MKIEFDNVYSNAVIEFVEQIKVIVDKHNSRIRKIELTNKEYSLLKLYIQNHYTAFNVPDTITELYGIPVAILEVTK